MAENDTEETREVRHHLAVEVWYPWSTGNEGRWVEIEEHNVSIHDPNDSEEIARTEEYLKQGIIHHPLSYPLGRTRIVLVTKEEHRRVVSHFS